MNQTTSVRSIVTALIEANPYSTATELAASIGWSPNRFYHACFRHGIKLRTFRKKRHTVKNFVGDLFLDAQDNRRDMYNEEVPDPTMNGYRVGRCFPSLARLRLLERLSGSKVTTTGRLRAAVNLIRNSTSDLETLSACGIMSDIIQEIEDAL